MSKAHFFSFKLNAYDQDIFEYLEHFQGMQKAVEFALQFRYILDKFDIEVSLPEDWESVKKREMTQEFIDFLNSQKNKRTFTIPEENVFLYQLLTKAKEEQYLSRYTKESIRLFLYGEIKKDGQGSNSALFSRLKKLLNEFETETINPTQATIEEKDEATEIFKGKIGF